MDCGKALLLTTFQACCYVNDKTMDFSSQFVKLPNNTIAAGFNREQSGSNTGDAHSCGGGVSSGEFSPDGNDVCLPASAPRYSISCSQWSIYEKGKSPRPVCAGTYKAETVVLGDGTTYTVKNMDLKLEEELYQFAWNGTTKEGIPQSYADYQIKIWI